MRNLFHKGGLILAPFILVLSMTTVFAQKKISETTLQNGDLLFVGSTLTGLSGAINEVTQTSKKTNYSHVALLEKGQEGCWVLQAVSTGTERISLRSFLEKKKKQGQKVVVYRIKSACHPHFNEAVKKAKTMLGKPYNWSYVLNDSSYYCASFVYFAYRKDSIFRMKPMTFKDSRTHSFNEKWKAYYQKLRMPIPEGKPGCNPNGMAASSKVKKIGRLW